jgi:hypothetical protein
MCSDIVDSIARVLHVSHGAALLYSGSSIACSAFTEALSPELLLTLNRLTFESNYSFCGERSGEHVEALLRQLLCTVSIITQCMEEQCASQSRMGAAQSTAVLQLREAGLLSCSASTAHAVDAY